MPQIDSNVKANIKFRVSRANQGFSQVFAKYLTVDKYFGPVVAVRFTKTGLVECVRKDGGKLCVMASQIMTADEINKKY